MKSKSYNKWKNKDFVKLRSLYKKGKTAREIAREIDKPLRSVRSYISCEINLGNLEKNERN